MPDSNTTFDHGNWFVGLPLPVADGNWYRDLLRLGPPELRFFQPDDIHMTIAFLGRMSLACKPDVIDVLTSLRAESFHVSLGRLRALPSEQHITALAFELERGAETARRLIADWRPSLYRAANARADSRPPLPHITIARPLRRSGRAGQRVAQLWSRSLTGPPEIFSLTRVNLYCWAADRRSRLFQVVHSRALDC